MRLELLPKNKKKTTISIYISEENISTYESNKGHISYIATQLLNFYLSGRLPLIDIPKMYEDKFFSLPNHEEILNQLVFEYCQGKIKLNVSSEEENLITSEEVSKEEILTNTSYNKNVLKQDESKNKKDESSKEELSNKEDKSNKEKLSNKEDKSNISERKQEDLNQEKDNEEDLSQDNNSEDFDYSLAFPLGEVEKM